MRIGGLACLLSALAVAAPVSVQAGEAAPNRSAIVAGDAAGLRAKAATAGGVRVFIRLGVALANEDGLSPAAAESQSLALASAQQGVVARALGGGQARHRVKTFRYVPYVAATVNAAELDSLLADGGVAQVSAVGARKISASGSWGVDKIEAPKVWKRGAKGGSVVVAVLDNGMQANHPMLAPKVVEEMCYSTDDPTAGYETLCPNGQEKMTGRGSSKNCPMTIDGCAHGTHVAGIAAGRSWAGLTGVAPAAGLILAQVFTKDLTEAEPDTTAFDDDIMAGLERVYSLRKKYTIAAVNMSLGSGRYGGVCDYDYPYYVEMFTRLREAKIAPLVASGNEYYTHYIGSPACVSTAIAVGATDRGDGLTAYSNHSQLVKMLAPGDEIQSSAPTGAKLTLSGTSMATPNAAGAFAILRDAVPGAQVAELQRALECTGKALERSGVRKRRIDVADALEVLKTGTNKPKVFDFDTAADGKKWKPAPGSAWKTTGGSYVPVFSAVPGQALAFTPNCNSDFDIEVKVKGGAEGQRVGVYLKSQISTSGTIISGYKFEFASFKFEGKWRTYHIAYRHDQVGLSTGGSSRLLYGDCGAEVDAPIKSFLIKIRGGQMTMIEGGKTIATVKDLTYTTGSIGLVVAYPDEGVNAIGIDSVTITSRDKPIDVKRDPSLAFDEADAPSLLQQVSTIERPQC